MIQTLIIKPLSNLNGIKLDWMVQVALLPFSLVVTKWRWNVMAGRITQDDYNEAWWQLTLRYQGNHHPAIYRQPMP